ncbi:MAG: DNA-binding protein [Gammaproteobacteria bacterium]|nr:MAG: DNA-binding protein [Gammaproteobacteria bacterium]RLA60893.1 MAG: DNA-binding protein [Gammaproteobacteria bacterium]
MEFKDYYKILGVDADASQKEIKSAYRKLARKYHPDVSDESDAEDQFKSVVEAYEVLKDQDKRAEYDTLRQYGGERFEPPPGWQSAASGASGGEYAGGFSDFFEDIFGQAGHGSRQGFSRQQFTQRGEDIEMGLSIFLEEAYHGETRTITYQVPSFDERGQFSRQAKTLNVKIPAGVTSGERIRLQGQGAPGLGEAPPGDLYLEVRIADHPLYEEEGVNLSLTLPISPWEAALGAKVTVPTLDGRINLSVPAASQSGKRLRVKGKGLGKAGKRGDLFVVLAISMPQSMDSEESALWRQLSEKSSYNPRENWGE